MRLGESLSDVCLYTCMYGGGREGGRGGLITEWDTDAKQAIYNNKLCSF